MTGEADFSEQEWKLVLQGPPSAGMIVVTAQSGGSLRESFSIAKSYTDARKQHGDSELLDAIAASKPEIDRTRYHSAAELKESCLRRLREAVELLEQKADPDEVDQYKRFVVTLARNVAEARREGFLGLSGERVSESERAAVDEIARALGTSAP